MAKDAHRHVEGVLVERQGAPGTPHEYPKGQVVTTDPAAPLIPAAKAAGVAARVSKERMAAWVEHDLVRVQPSIPRELGLTERQAEDLAAAGNTSEESLRAMTDEQLGELPGPIAKKVRKYLARSEDGIDETTRSAGASPDDESSDTDTEEAAL